MFRKHSFGDDFQSEKPESLLPALPAPEVTVMSFANAFETHQIS